MAIQLAPSSNGSEGMRTLVMSTDKLKFARIPVLIATLAGASLALSGCYNLPFFGGGSGGDGDRTEEPVVEGQEGQETEGDPFQNPEDMDVFSINVGDCIVNTDDAGPEATEVMSVPIVPCSQPHAYEVFHEFDLTGTSFPGSEQVTEAAREQCTGQAFTDYIGKAWNDSELTLFWYHPTPESWASGDRVVSCVVLEQAAEEGGNPTTGSLRDSRR